MEWIDGGGVRMKRVVTKFLAHDQFTKEDFMFAVVPILEVESYQEKSISKDPDIIAEHSFDELWESTKDMANGLWMFFRGLFGMSKWAFVILVEGISFLWRHGVDSKKKATEKEQVKKVK